MKERRKIFVILQWLNYVFGTHFCESGSERVVSRYLSGKNIKYICQKRLFGYRVDFLVGDIVIEVDGPHHTKIREKDVSRDSFLRSKGYRVIRLKASELWKDREHELSKLSFLVNDR